MKGMKTRKNNIIRSVILTCIMLVTLSVLYGQIKKQMLPALICSTVSGMKIMI